MLGWRQISTILPSTRAAKPSPSFAVEIGTSSSLLAKIEAGMPCKADAIARVEALLDAREGGK